MSDIKQSIQKLLEQGKSIRLISEELNRNFYTIRDHVRDLRKGIVKTKKPLRIVVSDQKAKVARVRVFRKQFRFSKVILTTKSFSIGSERWRECKKCGGKFIPVDQFRRHSFDCKKCEESGKRCTLCGKFKSYDEYAKTIYSKDSKYCRCTKCATRLFMYYYHNDPKYKENVARSQKAYYYKLKEQKALSKE